MKQENPILKELKSRGFRFKKQLGQNFLFHPFVLSQIVEAAEVGPEDTVIEIGAGAGTLTEALAQKGAQVVAIELDKALLPLLFKRFADNPRVTIVEGNALRMDLGQWAESYKVVANLPYHISTPMLTRLFRELRGVSGGAVMVQKEVAEKVTAKAGRAGYGMLALAAFAYGHVEQVMTLSPEYFVPPPPVDSAVLAFRRQPPTLPAEEGPLWQVIRGVLNQRRKSLTNGLKSLNAPVPKEGKTWVDVLAEAGIDGSRRGETLTLEEFAAITAAAGYFACSTSSQEKTSGRRSFSASIDQSPSLE